MDTVLTASGFEKLSAEHARLRAERETIVERLRSALEFGGAFPENGDYLDARHELELLDRRIVLLEERLFGAEIADPPRDGEVDLGERVTVLDLESGATGDYRVVGTGESDQYLLLKYGKAVLRAERSDLGSSGEMELRNGQGPTRS